MRSSPSSEVSRIQTSYPLTQAILRSVLLARVRHTRTVDLHNVCLDRPMTSKELLSVAVAGVPSLLVAIVGIVGVIVTQARADARARALAMDIRASESRERLGDLLREAVVEFTTAIWVTARVAREELGNGADTGHLEAAEMESIERAQSKVAILGTSGVRDAAADVIDAFHKWVETFDQHSWDGLDVAVDKFIETARSEDALSTST